MLEKNKIKDKSFDLEFKKRGAFSPSLSSKKEVLTPVMIITNIQAEKYTIIPIKSICWSERRIVDK